MGAKILDLLWFVVGPVLLVVAIFSFDSGESYRTNTLYYYYGSEALLMMALGVGLVAFGLVLRNWKKDRG